MSTSPSPAPAFPDPVEPAETVELRRSLRTRRLIGVSAVGIGVRVIVVIAELLVVRATGSATVLVDALATVADIVGSLVIVAAIKFAERPPDDDHPFGHGRFEPLAGLQLGLAMTVLGAALAIEQLTAPFSGGLETAWSPWLAAVPLAAAAALALTGRLVLRHGRRERSTALVAEAYHYRVDAVTSLCAAVGLLAAASLPAVGGWVDRAGAIALAGMMIYLGVEACRENLHQLTDGIPEDEHFDRVRQIAADVDGVLEVEKVQIQCAGPDAHVDIDIEVDPAETVADAHRTAQHVRAAIVEAWPTVRDVVVHVEPFYEGDH